MRLSIDVSSVLEDSLVLFSNFIKKPLLENLKLDTIKALNNDLRDLNQQGILYINDLKSNFDVEIGRDMFRDYDVGSTHVFVLWSGDSDFVDPVQQLLTDGKKVVLFVVVRKVAIELSALRASGLYIFDIQKIREFICYKREMTPTEVSFNLDHVDKTI